MESWIRAKEVAELVPLFAAPPTPPPPPREAPPAPQRPAAPERRVELPFESAGGHLTPPSAQPAAAAEVEEAASSDAPTPPGGTRIPEEAGSVAAPDRPADPVAAGEAVPTAPGALDLARWGAAELSKPRAHTPQPLPKAPQAPAREFRIGESQRRAPLRALLVVVGLALAGGLLAFALLSERRDRAADPAQQAGAPEGAAQATPAPAAGERKPEEKPPGTAPGETAAAAPPLTPDELKRKVDESKPVLQGCVEEAVKRDPALQTGKILLSATIAPSGAVTFARIDQKAVDQSPLGACLKSAARRMQFPPFAGEPFVVDIPLVVAGAP
jgi:hypothetical protein